MGIRRHLVRTKLEQQMAIWKMLTPRVKALRVESERERDAVVNAVEERLHEAA